MARTRRGAIGWTGLGRLITQRSQVQILPPLRELPYGVGPFLIGTAYVVLPRVTKVVDTEASGAVTWRDGGDALRRDKTPDTRSLGG
jgi:hypothetical protein